MNLEIDRIKSPAFVVDEDLLIKNLEILRSVKDRSGVKILLALKGFAMHGVAPIIMRYLDGIAASSLHEAKLGAEYFKKEVHVYSPAFLEDETAEMVQAGDHFIFNSLSQFRRMAPKFREGAKKIGRKIQIGLRVNHGYSEVKVKLYNPCVPGSRFGVLWQDLKEITESEWQLIDGLHFHTMCEQDADVLARTLPYIYDRVGAYFSKVKFLNLGGGHHITKPGYQLDLLVKILMELKTRFPGEVILEPGEAIALNTGFLVTRVVDIMKNDLEIAILDASATAHMPDVIEMPYRPVILGAGEPGEKAFTYRLGGLTCLAGDVIGDFSFDEPLRVGQALVFTDMAHYTMVKTSQFNGVRLPDIGLIRSKSRTYEVIRHFGYEDYKSMLS
jgi:carboxynorspermidine decarboxylase